MVDGKHQIIIEAQAYGEGQEHALLIPMLEGAQANFEGEELFEQATILADAGFCSEKNVHYLAEKEIEGYIADAMFRKRDPRFQGADHHKPTRPCEPHAKPRKDRLFQPKDFQLAKDRSHCICPAGKRLYKSGRALRTCAGWKQSSARAQRAPAAPACCAQTACAIPNALPCGRSPTLSAAPRIIERVTAPA
jgi:hypothetical protein